MAKKNKFEFIDTSPKFFYDWTWYKDVLDTEDYWNNKVLEQWNSARLLTLDKRLNFNVFSSDNLNLSNLENRINELGNYISEVSCGNYTYSNSDKKVIPPILDEIIFELENVSSKNLFKDTVFSLSDFKNAWPELVAGNHKVDTKSFENWWGRGMQYISFTGR